MAFICDFYTKCLYLQIKQIDCLTLKQVIMAQFTGQNDEQFAAGAAIGGAASLIGPTAAGAAKVAAVKLGALGALKAGIGVGLAVNPFFAGAALVGGAGYLIYKACK